jgi:hypothetical protein
VLVNAARYSGATRILRVTGDADFERSLVNYNCKTSNTNSSPTAFSLQHHEGEWLFWYSLQFMTMKPATLRLFISRPAIRRTICITRGYAVQSPGNPTLEIFSRNTKWLQKERAAADVEHSRKVDYLKDEVAMRLSERLLVLL